MSRYYCWGKGKNLNSEFYTTMYKLEIRMYKKIADRNYDSEQQNAHRGGGGVKMRRRLTAVGSLLEGFGLRVLSKCLSCSASPRSFALPPL